MDINTTPNTARGEFSLVVGGQPVTVRFGMNVMRDVTKATGHGTSEFATLLSTNFDEAATIIVACAVKRYAQLPDFTQDDAGDLLDGLSRDENDALADALAEAVSVGPLMAALLKKVAAKQEALAPVPSESGTSTSTSLSAS